MEPERKIEKLLRAYAKKRRAEAGDALELHPATRRILQGEAARRAPKPGEGGIVLLLLAAFRRRLAFALCVVGIITIGTALLLPGLSSAKKEAQNASALSNLREIGMATRRYASDNKERLPVSLDEVTNALGTSKVLIDPASGKPFVYAGGGKILDELQSNVLLAYSPADRKDRAVLFADGRVETVSGAQFSELTNQKSLELALADTFARARPVEAPVGAPPAAARPAAPPQTTGELEKGKLGVAGVAQRRLEQPATSTTLGEIAGSVNGLGQTNALQGPISGTLLAVKSPETGTHVLSFDKVTAQTEAAPPVSTAAQQFVQAGFSFSSQNRFKNYSAASPAAPVLANFQLQQNGDAICVVDQDGSVYNGSLQSENAAVRNAPISAERVPPTGAATAQIRGREMQAGGGEQPAMQNYFFRVAGTNQTLKQNVVFTGNLVVNNGALPTAQTSNFFGGTGGGGAGGQLERVSANQSGQWLLSNSRIAGTAVIDNTNQIEINAVPVTP